MSEYDFDENDDLQELTEEEMYENSYYGQADAYGHVWGTGWEESDKPHPGFGGSQDIYGCYVDQCMKCRMYGYEFQSCTATPGKYENQFCKDRVR